MVWFSGLSYENQVCNIRRVGIRHFDIQAGLHIWVRSVRVYKRINDKGAFFVFNPYKLYHG